mmetsp:Transcript_2832/g.11329  ORF Transcript_2832/g.11329 Transcript_2832/m.11329 type:complete len:259 (+) Transcript_2832:2492-3268(+)
MALRLRSRGQLAPAEPGTVHLVPVLRPGVDGRAAAQLRRQVVHVRVVVRLLSTIRVARLHRLEPGVDGRPAAVVAAAHHHAFVVGDAGGDALQERREGKVDVADLLAQEVGPRAHDGQRIVGGVHDVLEVLHPLLVRPAAREPLQPPPEELALQLEHLVRQRALLAAGRRQHGRLVRKGLFDPAHDDVRLGDQAAVQFHDGQHAGGHLRQEGRGLVAVAAQGRLDHAVGDALLLELQPDLLAVRAPGGVVTVQRDAHV